MAREKALSVPEHARSWFEQAYARQLAERAANPPQPAPKPEPLPEFTVMLSEDRLFHHGTPCAACHASVYLERRWNEGKPLWRVRCPVCAAATPWTPGRDEALRAWTLYTKLAALTA